MSKLENAVQRLYEDISLREELTDNEAEVLLKWAEGKVVQLDDEIADEETFDEQFKQLRRMMKRMNKFIGNRGDDDLEKQQQMVLKFLDSAAELGIKVNQAQIQAFLAAQQNQSNDDVLRSMLGMLEADPTPTEEMTTPTEPDDSATLETTTNAASSLFGALKGIHTEAKEQELKQSNDAARFMDALRDAHVNKDSNEQEEQ